MKIPEERSVFNNVSNAEVQCDIMLNPLQFATCSTQFDHQNNVTDPTQGEAKSQPTQTGPHGSTQSEISSPNAPSPSGLGKRTRASVTSAASSTKSKRVRFTRGTKLKMDHQRKRVVSTRKNWITSTIF